MDKTRLEAFSDGVFAILITIMVLELKTPESAGFDALRSLGPVFLAYVLSFVYLAIYWNNHHHMFHAVDRINGRILWANAHLLFWLSLFPFVTAWIGKNHVAALPTAVYGMVAISAAVAYSILVWALMADGINPRLAEALGRDVKGKVSIGLYATGLGLAYVNVWLADSMYVLVALMWLVPDRRIEKPAAARRT
jgi:uncharacterized membrane protein